MGKGLLAQRITESLSVWNEYLQSLLSTFFRRCYSISLSILPSCSYVPPYSATAPASFLHPGFCFPSLLSFFCVYLALTISPLIPRTFFADLTSSSKYRSGVSLFLNSKMHILGKQASAFLVFDGRCAWFIVTYSLTLSA